MIRLTGLFFLVLIAGMQSALAQVEIVIDVSDAQALTILQSYEADELLYADLSWESSGRIRLAKINIDALKQSDYQIQFTPFPDVKPIVMTSRGVGGDYGYTWTGERISNRVDGLPDRQTLKAELEADFGLGGLDASSAEFITADILQEFETVNTVTLNIGSVLMDANKREFLFDPNGRNAEHYLIDPETGQTRTIDGLEGSFKWLVEKAGIEYPCEKRAIAKPQSVARGAAAGTLNANAARESSPPVFYGFESSSGVVVEMAPGGGPEFIDRNTGHVTNSKHGYVFLTKSGERGITVPCKPPGDVLDRLADLPNPYREWSSARNYERIKPLPASARYFESVGGSIRDKSISPMLTSEEYRAVDAKTYWIKKLSRHPEYIVIYERDSSKRYQLPIDLPGLAAEKAWENSEAGKRVNTLTASKTAHMDAAKMKISARAQPQGGNK